jgi:fibronectin type 3 domain-containing protein
LPVPSGLQVSRPQVTSANLAWNAQNGANGYEVYRASSMGGSYALIKTLAGTSMTDSGLSANTSYYYKIRSFSTAGEIKFYSEMSQSVLAPLITPGVTATPLPSATEPQDYPAEPVPWFYFIAGFIIAGLLATVVILIKFKK